MLCNDSAKASVVIVYAQMYCFMFCHLEWTEDDIVIIVYSENYFYAVAMSDGFYKSCILYILFFNFLRHFVVLGCGFNAGQKVWS